VALAPLAWRYIRHRRVLAYFDQGVDLLVQSEQRPLRASAISAGSTMPLADGLLPVSVDWRVDGAELAAIRSFTLAAATALERHGLARLAIDQRLLAGDSAFLQSCTDTFHSCGGAIMGSSRASGVTDPDCLVWGTRNVHVAGASVMPSSSYANCTFTALALATRLADRLHERSLQ
jgi:choline dehydrogenase-like flavoprotein